MLDKVKKRLKSNKNPLLVAIVVVLLQIPGPVSAQQVKELSLKETIELAISNSNRLKAGYARSAQAAASLKEAKNSRLPDATVSGSYVRMGSPDINLKTNAFKPGPDSAGGSFKMPNVNQAMYGIVNVSYPIFTGGRIRYGIESARLLEKAAQLDMEDDRQEVILNAVEAYINLYKANATVTVVEENLAQSRKRDSVFSRLEQTGLMARNDLLKAELQTSNIELSLLDAQNNKKLATVNMNLLLGLADSTYLRTVETFDTPLGLKTLKEYQQIASAQRKDLSAITFRKEVSTKAIASTRAEKYPSVVLTGGYIAANIPHLLSITNAINAGIGIQYNIGSLWKNKARLDHAKQKQNEIIANQAQLHDAIIYQVTKAYEDYLLALKKTEVYKKAVIQAEENFRITGNKYKNNLVNTTELLDANVLRLQAEINLASANADVMLTYSKLMEETGTLSTYQF